MERVEVSRYFISLFAMQVCAVADATDEEILAVSNRDNLCGTTNGWVTVHREDHEREESRPVDCAEHEGRKHFIVSC